MPNFIEKDFSSYGLPEFDQFKDLINICAYDGKLYRILPYLLRNLFENLIYYILRDGLDPKHTPLFFDISKTMSRDLSELIAILNIIKDDSTFKKLHKNTITNKTIAYLGKVRKDGNIDVHEIITQTKSDYAINKKEEINLILESLLPFYRTINKKLLQITDIITLQKIIRALRLIESLTKQNARELIEMVKGMEKNEMSDLILDLEFDKLLEIVRKMIAEIILIKDFDEKEEKLSLYDFIIYAIKIREKIEEQSQIFQLVVNVIIKQNDFKTWNFFENLPDLLKIESINKYSKKENLLRNFLILLQNSHSYAESAINAEIVYILKETLSKSDILNIADWTINNRQISESGKAASKLKSLFFEFQKHIDEDLNKRLNKVGLGIHPVMRI
ncbi:hypothetical protein LCGC14_1225260 [marine sediment metagenome]|uniref:Uncharacterized protein n=1 Tax=marine sediment metagenome TaxID=412755 RepID=A0A0F9LA66_9ZZZZ